MLVVFVAALIVLVMLTNALSRSVRSSPLGKPDRILGAGFGVLCAWVAIGAAFLFYGYLGPRQLPPAVEGGATFPMIKEMANFVEPYLPPGFRTRLQAAAADTGGDFRAIDGSRLAADAPGRRAKPPERPNRRSEISLMRGRRSPDITPPCQAPPRRLRRRPRQVSRGMCVVRHLRDFRRRRPHRAGPACPAASRPGGLRHRHLRRPAFPRSSRRRPGRRQFRRAVGHRQAARAIRAIGHNRYATTGGSSRPQHPADLRRFRLRRPGARPQRQSHQRLPAAQGAGADAAACSSRPPTPRSSST